LIFKVEPVVTVLQAENMIWPFIYISCSKNAELETDQSTLYREEAREICLSVRHSDIAMRKKRDTKEGTDLRTSVLVCVAQIKPISLHFIIKTISMRVGPNRRVRRPSENVEPVELSRGGNLH
jgi:hypothetical protein